MRRLSIIVVLLTIAVGLLTACGQPATQAALPQPQSTASAQPTATKVAPTAQPTQTAAVPTTIATSVPTVAATSTPAPISATQALTTPVRVTITREGLAEPIIDVVVVPGGVILSGGHRIPWTDDHKATWYTGYCGVGPAYSCRVFISGHRLKWKKTPEIPAPFKDLPKVKVGDTLTIYTADGNSQSFPVTLSKGVAAEEAGQFVGRSKGHPVITLMTCSGNFTQQDGETIASDRWVVEA